MSAVVDTIEELADLAIELRARSADRPLAAGERADLVRHIARLDEIRATLAGVLAGGGALRHALGRGTEYPGGRRS